MLIDILCYVHNSDSLNPNYHILKQRGNRSAKQETQIGHFVLPNRITQVHADGTDKSMLEGLQYLISLCPCLQYPETRIREHALYYLTEILSSKYKNS